MAVAVDSSPQRCPCLKDTWAAAEQEVGGGVFTLRAKHRPARSPLLTHHDSGAQGPGQRAQSTGTGCGGSHGGPLLRRVPAPHRHGHGGSAVSRRFVYRGHVPGGLLRPAPGTLSGVAGPCHARPPVSPWPLRHMPDRWGPRSIPLGFYDTAGAAPSPPCPCDGCHRPWSPRAPGWVQNVTPSALVLRWHFLRAATLRSFLRTYPPRVSPLCRKVLAKSVTRF